MRNHKVIWMDTELSKPLDLPEPLPPWVQGIGFGIMFGLILFGDAITVWFS